MATEFRVITGGKKEGSPEREKRPALKDGGDGGTLGGMDRVWEKLADHDKRFDRIERELTHIGTELSNAKFWFVGTTAAITLAGLGLVYAARQDTTATIGAALSAIQTVIAAKQEPAQAQPPTVIVVPSSTPALATYPPRLAPPETPKP